MARRFKSTGSTENVSLADTNANLTVFTYWGWLKLYHYADTSLMLKGTFGGSSRRILELTLQGTRGFLFDGAVDAGTTRGTTSALSSPLLGLWTFCAMTYDGAGDRIVRLFSGLETEVVRECSHTVVASAGVHNTDAGTQRYIGAFSIGQPSTLQDALIASCGILNRVVTREELEELQRDPLMPLSGRIGTYMLGAVAGTTELDYSGAGFPGTVNGVCPIVSDEPRFSPKPRRNFISLSMTIRYTRLERGIRGLHRGVA